MPGAKSPSRGRIAKPHENQVLLDTAMQEVGIYSTYELASRAGVAASVLYKFRKGKTTRFYGTTELRLASVLPNLFGKRTLSPSEMRVKSAPLRQQFAKTVAKIAAAKPQATVAKKSSSAPVKAKAKSFASATKKASKAKSPAPAPTARAKKAAKPSKVAKKKATR